MVEKMAQRDLELINESDNGGQLVAVLERPYALKLARAKIPEPQDGEVRVRVKWVGICGSDLKAYTGARALVFLTFPTRLGHEVAGVIDMVGPNVRGLKQGDRVVLRYVWGAFAQYTVCKPFSVMKIPDTISLEEASPIEVLPGILHAAELGKIDPSKNVLIMGQGVSGLLLTQVVKLFSPRRLVVTDLHDHKLELARKYGATHTYKVPTPETPTMDVVGKDFPDGFDVVIPSLLEGEGMVDAIDAAAQNGVIVMYGCVEACKKTIDFFKVHRKRLDILSTEPKRDIDNRRLFEESVRLVAEGLVNTGEIVTHRFPLSQIAEAFQLRAASSPEAIHILIDCE
jgi:2-desacetyl-2-hydroxyethyl bacteriochlorophyllide A dehydrogenase